ncbi:MAG: hypothetical protein AB1427_01125 [Thermodesulfobacteriota bacterium]
MDQGIAALLGVVIGFVLPSLASLIRSQTIGKRFIVALNEELKEAKDSIHNKMSWVSRDADDLKDRVDPRLLVDCGGRQLFLGEDENFFVALPFWENNTREIVESISTREFKRICSEVFLIRRFVSKFRDMKLAFKTETGDPRWMARVCYQDLIEIHDELFSEWTLPQPPPDERGDL